LTEAATPKRSDSAALSRELGDFLIDFSIGVHRYAMYPEDHPSLEPIVDKIVRDLGRLFLSRQHLSIGVAARQLIIEGVATDSSHPVLADLATRLHSHQLGAVSFQLGVTAPEISGLLSALAEKSERGSLPLGLRDDDAFPRWEHARLYKVGYDKLELKDGEGGTVGHMDQATELWLGLAQAALRSAEPLDEPPDAALIARSIEKNARDEAYDQVIVGYLLQIADELKDANAKDSDNIRGRVSRLMSELDEDTLARLVDFGGDPAQRKRFVLDANESLAVDSVLKVLTAASTASSQTISTSMTRMLTKMAVHAQRGAPAMRAQADAALRQNVEALMEGWDLTDPNPEEYTSVLDAMAKAAPVLRAPDAVRDLNGSERLLKMALELDGFGPTVTKALLDLTDAGRIVDLLEMVDGAPEDSEVATRIMAHLESPDQFRKILEAEDIGITVILMLLPEMGEAAADPLLDVLMESESRSVRRRVFDILAGMGTFVGPRVLVRIKDERWYVQRNMLALLQRHTYVLDGFDPGPYLEHPDERVRQEALPLALRPGCPLRDRALLKALSDDSERMVRMGLLTLQDGVPDAAVAPLAEHVVASRKRGVDLRAMGAKALAHSRMAIGRTTLLEVVSAGKTFFGRPRIAPKSALVIAGLRALAQAWSGHPDVERVLQSARRSRDPAIRDAAQAAGARAS